MIQRHSQLPQGSSGILRDEARPEVVVAESSQRADPGSLLRPMRHGPSPIRSQRIGGELVLWSFKDFPRIFQGFPRWRVESQWSFFTSRADMYWYVSSTAANAGLGQEKTNLTNYRRLKFVSLHSYSLAALPVVNLCGHASNITLLDSYNKMRTVPTNAKHILLLLCCCGCSMIFGCEPFTNPSWANRGGKTRCVPLWFASSRSFRRRALLATTGAGAKCERNGNGRPETVKLVFTKKVKLKSPGRCLLVEHRHLKVLTAVFRDDLLHRTRRENWCGLRLSDAGRRLQATNCIKQVRWWNCFLVERFASFWDLPGYWYPLCIAHLLPPLTNPWDHLDSEKSWECHGGYPQLSSIFSDFLGFSMK